MAIAERIRNEIQTLPPLPELSGRSLTISIGVAMVSPQIKSAEHLLELSDQALYQAKTAGRNRVVLHTPEVVLAVSGTEAAC